jgi:UDP-GlcNAc3NAcA epimerase
VGDTMYDATLKYGALARENSSILSRLDLQPGCYSLVTIHRAYNTDYSDILNLIFSALEMANQTIIFPIHPRTEIAVKADKITIPDNVELIPPVGYLDMLTLEQNARIILTDSGGIQKEAYFLQIPCLTLRPETEWVETTSSGWNKLVRYDAASIAYEMTHFVRPEIDPIPVFGDGDASIKIVKLLES